MNINQVIMGMSNLVMEKPAPLNLQVGDVLAAKVAVVKGEMVLLLLNNKVPLQSRTDGQLELKEGQQVDFVVKSMEGNKVVLQIAEGARPAGQSADHQIRALLGQMGMDTTEDGIETVRLLMNNGVPVTKENIESAAASLKSLQYILQNIDKMEEVDFPAELKLLKMPVEKIARWLVHKEEGGTAGHVPEKGGQILKEVLQRISARDVVRVLKTGTKSTPETLDIVKNIREYEGFFKTLVKGLQGYLEREEDMQALRHVFSEEILKHNGITRLSKLLDLLNDGEIDGETVNTLVGMIFERANIFHQIFKGLNLFIIPFVFDRKIQEAIILVDEENKSDKEDSRDSVQLNILTNTDFLGRMEVAVRKQNKTLTCCFYTQSEEVSTVIVREKDFIEDRLNTLGYRLAKLECITLEKQPMLPREKFFDMRV